jgi:UDP-N-acetylglucosamine 2-epimerase (non-hydrolysing)
MKVLTLIGTRPEIIKLSRVLAKLDENVDHVIVHTGQNYDYELNKIFFDELEIRKPNYFLNAASSGAIETISNVLVKVDEVLEAEKPDALLLLGDTNSGLGIIAAKKRKIPIFHMEAGNRCFDQRVPEEVNRKIIDHLSDINMPYSSIAREYLLSEGLPPDQIIKTGSPMLEVLSFYKEKIKSSQILKTLNVESNKYFVLSTHREENVDQTEKLKEVCAVLNVLSESYNYPILFSLHPRTQNRLEKLNVKLHPLVQIMKPLGFFDYIHLQQNAFCVISDSGTITEESSILGFPAINIRDAHERPEGMEEGAVILTGINLKTVLDSINYVTSDASKFQSREIVKDYNVANVSDKVLKIIFSYTGFVNNRVWKK